jgi:hypothetical protein
MIAAFYVKKLEGARQKGISSCNAGGKGSKESSPTGAGYNCINRKAAIG